MSILSYTLSFDTFINTLCINKGVKSQRYHFQDSADPKQEAISNMVFALVPRLIQGSMGHRYVYSNEGNNSCRGTSLSCLIQTSLKLFLKGPIYNIDYGSYSVRFRVFSTKTLPESTMTPLYDPT